MDNYEEFMTVVKHDTNTALLAKFIRKQEELGILDKISKQKFLDTISLCTLKLIHNQTLNKKVNEQDFIKRMFSDNLQNLELSDEIVEILTCAVISITTATIIEAAHFTNSGVSMDRDIEKTIIKDISKNGIIISFVVKVLKEYN